MPKFALSIFKVRLSHSMSQSLWNLSPDFSLQERYFSIARKICLFFSKRGRRGLVGAGIYFSWLKRHLLSSHFFWVLRIEIDFSPEALLSNPEHIYLRREDKKHIISQWVTALPIQQNMSLCRFQAPLLWEAWQSKLFFVPAWYQPEIQCVKPQVNIFSSETVQDIKSTNEVRLKFNFCPYGHCLELEDTGEALRAKRRKNQLQATASIHHSQPRKLKTTPWFNFPDYVAHFLPRVLISSDSWSLQAAHIKGKFNAPE